MAAPWGSLGNAQNRKGKKKKKPAEIGVRVPFRSDPSFLLQARLAKRSDSGLGAALLPAGPPGLRWPFQRLCTGRAAALSPPLGDLARLAARPMSRLRHLPGRWARARPSGSDSRAASRARVPVRAAGRAGRATGARGAGPGRGLGAAPPAKLLAGAASGRAVRAGASRL